MCSLCKRDTAVADPETGEMICNNCGTVLSEKAVETRAEWRIFDVEQSSRARAGARTSLAQHDMGLATVIGRANKDASGNILNSGMRSSISRLRIWDSRTQLDPSDRNLRVAFEQLHKLKSKLGLSDAVVEKTAYIYRKAFERKFTRGRSISSMLVACLYIACRDMGAPRSFKEIAAISNLRRKDITYSYRMLILGLDIKVPLPDPAKCIVRIANKVKISEKTKRLALEKMGALIMTEISAGKGPMGLAATVLYLSCLNNGESITQKDLAEAAGVTEVTIRNRVRDLNSRARTA